MGIKSIQLITAAPCQTRRMDTGRFAMLLKVGISESLAPGGHSTPVYPSSSLPSLSLSLLLVRSLCSCVFSPTVTSSNKTPPDVHKHSRALRVLARQSPKRGRKSSLLPHCMEFQAADSMIYIDSPIPNRGHDRRHGAWTSRFPWSLSWPSVCAPCSVRYLSSVELKLLL